MSILKDLPTINANAPIKIRPRIIGWQDEVCVDLDNPKKFQCAAGIKINSIAPAEKVIGKVGQIAFDEQLYRHLSWEQKQSFVDKPEEVEGKGGKKFMFYYSKNSVSFS